VDFHVTDQIFCIRQMLGKNGTTMRHFHFHFSSPSFVRLVNVLKHFSVFSTLVTLKSLKSLNPLHVSA
jgi:hypothetical protein